MIFVLLLMIGCFIGFFTAQLQNYLHAIKKENDIYKNKLRALGIETVKFDIDEWKK